MREIGEQITAARAAAVIYETFGHLDAKPGERHKGWFVFINGQHGNMDVVYSEFQTFGEGPGYFTDREDFIWELTRGDGHALLSAFTGSMVNIACQKEKVRLVSLEKPPAFRRSGRTNP